MQEREGGEGTRNHILLLPRDLEIERQLQERLDGHRMLFEDPSPDPLLVDTATYETPILEVLLRVGSANLAISALKLRGELGQRFNPELFTAASLSIRTVLSGEGVQ